MTLFPYTTLFRSDVGPILAAMAAFGDKWLLSQDRPLLILHHVACAHDMHAVVTCSECAEPLDIRSMQAKPGPGYPKHIPWRGRAPQQSTGSTRRVGRTGRKVN